MSDTVWIRNKRTGLVWQVSGELAGRLRIDPDYEQVDPPVPARAPASASTGRKRGKKTARKPRRPTQRSA